MQVAHCPCVYLRQIFGFQTATVAIVSYTGCTYQKKVIQLWHVIVR